MQPLANFAPGAQARLGTTLSGKWRVDKVLGVGGVATVFLVTHRNQSRAALKLLHPEQAQNPTVRDRFVHEGYAANSIDHPGVVRVIDDDITEDGLPYLVMELLEGETLEDRAYRHGDRLPAGDVLALADQLLDVLVVAHEKRVVHRDLKPDNLFLTREGRLKVLDFGIARLTETVPRRDVTEVGTLLGTPSFMPPEQARSRWEEVDAQSDLYAVGATMFALLTGRFVREAETLTEQLALAIHQPAPKLASVDPSQDSAVCALIDKALAYEKRDRFADARSMQQEVRRVRELVPPPLTTSVTPTRESPRAPRDIASPEARTLLESGRVASAVTKGGKSGPITIAIERRVAAAGALVLLLGAALATWFFWPKNGQAPRRAADASSGPSQGSAAPVPPSAAPAFTSTSAPAAFDTVPATASSQNAGDETGAAPTRVRPATGNERGATLAPHPATTTSASARPVAAAPSTAPLPAAAPSHDPFSTRY